MRMRVPGIVVRGRRAFFAGGLLLTVLAAAGALAVFVFQPFGHRGWAFAGVSALLAASWLPRAPRPRWRLATPERAAVAGGLACWLGLIAWAAASAGGSMPRPKADPAAIRVLTLPKRICTWVRLRDLHSGRTLRVYNTHLYLTERARLPAARIIRDQIAAGDPADSVLLAGDFNAPPSAPSRRLFAGSGLVSTVAPPGQPPPSTYQFYGIRLKCLDDILLSRDLRVEAHQVVDVKPENTFPSDHFGILADVALDYDQL